MRKQAYVNTLQDPDMAPNTITDAQGNTLRYRARTNNITVRPQSTVSSSGLKRFHDIKVDQDIESSVLPSSYTRSVFTPKI